MGGILAAATASSPTPCPPMAESVTAAPVASTAAPAPKGASTQPARWRDRPTQYASGDHLWFSWRSSMVRWLGGQPVPTMKEARTASAEGWWGEPVNMPPSTLAYAPSDR